MPSKKKPLVVAGIDVGGQRKGSHAVALKDGSYLARCQSVDLDEIVKWSVNTMQAQVIAIDAPCRWSSDGRSRPAERALMKERIWCFSTPTEERAKDHPTNHFGWMRQGIELFQKLEATHPLCHKTPLSSGSKYCFETFPHAITCALRGELVSAKSKRKDRKALLEEYRVISDELTNIDLVDAALCALTAHLAASDKKYKSYGEPDTGLIIVPTISKKFG